MIFECTRCAPKKLNHVLLSELVNTRSFMLQPHFSDILHCFFSFNLFWFYHIVHFLFFYGNELARFYCDSIRVESFPGYNLKVEMDLIAESCRRSDNREQLLWIFVDVIKLTLAALSSASPITLVFFLVI